MKNNWNLSYSKVLNSLEYQTAHLLSEWKQPVLSVLCGVTMGGGVGITVYSSHSVCSQKTKWAMPECKIGGVPDISACYFLTREHVGLSVGRFIGMSSFILNGADLKYSKLATHFVTQEALLKVKDNIEYYSQNLERLDELTKECPGEGESYLKANREDIEKYFGEGSPIEIIKRVFEGESAFAKETASRMKKNSVMSMVLTWMMMERGKEGSVWDAIELDYKVFGDLIRKGNVPEGVRALLIDKDNQPKFLNDTLEIDCEALEKEYFS